MIDYTSHWADLGGPTHYISFGGPADAPPLVAVHGLGGSHANWLAVGPALAEHYRVFALDLAGHGRTRPDRRRTDVHSNQRLLDRFLTEVVGGPAVLMGNSMGGMISILQASRKPETVAGVVLLSPAVPVPRGVRRDRAVSLTFLSYAVPGLGPALLVRRRRRLTPEQQVQQVLDLCCVDSSRVPRAAVEHAVALAKERRAYEHLEAAFLEAARSVMLTIARRDSYAAHLAAVEAPVLLLQGERDRLVSVAAARAAAAQHPHWRLEVAPDVGHVPQLEAPGWTVERILEWRASIVTPST
jgi:pimeloyl-ACP methyl ester carboxylesterase